MSHVANCSSLQREYIFENTLLAMQILEERAGNGQEQARFLGEEEGWFREVPFSFTAATPKKVFSLIDRNIALIDRADHLTQLSQTCSRVSDLFARKQGGRFNAWWNPDKESAEWQKGLRVSGEAAQHRASSLPAAPAAASAPAEPQGEPLHHPLALSPIAMGRVRELSSPAEVQHAYGELQWLQTEVFQLAGDQRGYVEHLLRLSPHRRGGFNIRSDLAGHLSRITTLQVEVGAYEASMGAAARGPSAPPLLYPSL